MAETGIRETYRIIDTGTVDDNAIDTENLASLALGCFCADRKLALLVLRGGGNGQDSGEESEQGDELGLHFEFGVKGWEVGDGSG